jgi:hypothetical protein
MNFEFTNYETGVVFNLTSMEMLTVLNTLKITEEELAELLTGLTVDSYADLCENIDVEDQDDDYQLCRAFHRILNTRLLDVDCEEAWLESLVN